jgi:hypothetical protein
MSGAATPGPVSAVSDAMVRLHTWDLTWGHVGDTPAADATVDALDCRDFAMGRGGFEPPSDGL